MKIVLDNSNNDFNSQYPSWPFRVWIINETQRIEYKGMANANSGFDVNLCDIKCWLDNYALRLEGNAAVVACVEKC